MPELVLQETDLGRAQQGVRAESNGVDAGDISPVAEGEVREPTRYPITFTGSGAEYFRIWIVNLVLTVLTLGIYSAWAKVRRLQYFHRHTVLDNASFDFHGKPADILKGRVIAVVLFAAYSGLLGVSVVAAVIAGSIIGVLGPWFLVNMMRFRARNTTYRGLRFRFRGKTGEAYRLFAPLVSLFLIYVVVNAFMSDAEILARHPLFLLLIFAANLLIFSAALPFFHYRYKAFTVEHTRFGTSALQFTASLKDYYLLHGRMWGLVIGTSVVAGLFVMLGFGIGSVFNIALGEAGFTILGLSPFLLMLLFMPVSMALWVSRTQNLGWGRTRIEGQPLTSQTRVRSLAKLHIKNLLLIVLTLGLYKPFAAVAVARYRLESVALESNVGLDHFVSAAADMEKNALGLEVADVAMIDLGL